MPGVMSAEANVLHAVMENDDGEARRLLADFLPGEIAGLMRAAGALMDLCSAALAATGTGAPFQGEDRPARGECAVVIDNSCLAPPGSGSTTSRTCFACGLPVCSNCSRLEPWHNFGIRRIGLDCLAAENDARGSS